jgi:hypothetical protein
LGFRGTQLSVLIGNREADEKKKGSREGVLCIELACCKCNTFPAENKVKINMVVMK